MFRGAGFVVVIGGVGLSIAAGWWLWLAFTPFEYRSPSFGQAGLATSSSAVVTGENNAKTVIHLPTPESLKAIYMTQCVAATPIFRERLIKMVEETELNAIVVDLKDFSGTVVFPSETALPGGGGCGASDFAELVAQMHQADIYVIGRLSVFQDPLYALAYPDQAVRSVASGGIWRDRKGLAFVDVSAEPFWGYIVDLAKEAHKLGVDEINFDYVRYPSDGNMADAKYIATGLSKSENLELFFKYLAESLRPLDPNPYSLSPVLSADLFGMTTTNYDDLNIGQVLERALPYFDYIAPMVYPSHYPKNFNGWPDPNEKAYEIVKFSLDKAVARTIATSTPVACGVCESISVSATSTSHQSLVPSYSKPAYSRAKIRPWLQDFNYPVPYTAEMVKAQIQATYDAGLTGWMLWDPRNQYTRSALESS